MYSAKQGLMNYCGIHSALLFMFPMMISTFLRCHPHARRRILFGVRNVFRQTSFYELLRSKLRQTRSYELLRNTFRTPLYVSYDDFHFFAVPSTHKKKNIIWSAECIPLNKFL